MLSQSKDTVRVPRSPEHRAPTLRPTPHDRGRSSERRPALRVFIVENHSALRRALRDLLGADPRLAPVDAASDPAAALGEAARFKPDVVVVDDSVGVRDALVLTRQLKALEHPPRVLVLSAYADALLAVVSVVAGADGLISKGALGDELCQAVRGLGRGGGEPLRITPHAFGVAAFQLDSDDVPLLSMLCHATPPNQIARLAGITPARLDARRWAMLKRLTDGPGLFYSSGSRKTPDRA